LGRLPLPDDPANFLPAELGKNRIESLPIVDTHAFQAGSLPRHHRDPFDRMLVAQAQVESLELISNDPKINLYDVRTCW
jgi:PIN domain nuclease of toxin-antitoxin system